MTDKIRIDKYLWAIRIFKTRSKATKACEKGKVKRQGEAIKASKAVVIGEEYEIKTSARKWLIQVTDLLQQRVKYKEAVKYYSDITPEADRQYNKRQADSFYTGKRQSKIGRPTKKQRRDLDDFLNQ